jgi:hypothetical protein
MEDSRQAGSMCYPYTWKESQGLVLNSHCCESNMRKAKIVRTCHSLMEEEPRGLGASQTVVMRDLNPAHSVLISLPLANSYSSFKIDSSSPSRGSLS